MSTKATSDANEQLATLTKVLSETYANGIWTYRDGRKVYVSAKDPAPDNARSLLDLIELLPDSDS